jgi:hypothetical protein
MPRLSKIGAAALAAFGWTGLSTVSASYLQVAGGGGGAGGSGGGGGGAGGYLTGTTTLNTTQSYTVIVGSGGVAGASSASAIGTNGSSSQFGTLTASVGGGTGGSYPNGVGTAGGSGGGGAYSSGAGGAGTSGQGYAGGSGASASTRSQGGGGGAGAVGANGVGNVSGGNGGVGLASSISGTSTYYAGGGGGGSETVTGGTGGNGGGGAGAFLGTSNGISGTANTGGGGGGGYSTSVAGNGGSGIVIISYLGAQQFGGGVVTSSGGYTIHTFNTSGTLAPLSSLTASALIVAGGGGGGAYTASGYVAGTSGANSSFSIYSTASVGGGGGKVYPGSNSSVGAGGSGGGGTGYSSPQSNPLLVGGSGTSGQGNAGGSGQYGGGNGYWGGGGGGAGAVGANASSTNGNGGVGLTSSISGTSTYYAGGGGGGSWSSSGGSAGTGGLGGGGNGGFSSAGSAGTANTGGGGGGGDNGSGSGSGGGGAGGMQSITGQTIDTNSTYLVTVGAGGAGSAYGGAGGSGIVIISYAGSVQQMAGGTVTISGGNVIHTFTSSGYLTPLKFVGNSLRFRSSASAYLNRTPTVTGNVQKYTESVWAKRGKLGTGQWVGITSGQPSNYYIGLYFDSTDSLAAYVYFNGTLSAWQGQLITTAKYRDPAAWYHLVLAVDTTQATSTDRIKLYVNGVQVTSFSTANYPNQNQNTLFNTTALHLINCQQDISLFYDGEITELNWVDGQTLTPNSFGTFNSYGVWQPITYGGSYGTNGFYLPFTNKTSTTTLGYDFSPAGNNWTPNNISLTSGSTYDSMTDVPTLTSATAANTATFNPLDYVNNNTSSLTLTNGNLLVTRSTNAYGGYPATMTLPTSTAGGGKFAFEFTAGTAFNGSTTEAYIGIAVQSNGAFTNSSASGYAGDYYTCVNITGGNGYVQKKISGGSVTNVYTGGSAVAANDVFQFLVDMTNGTVDIKKNGSAYGTQLTGLPTTLALFPYVSMYTSAGSVNISANFGQQPWNSTPTTGYVALNTYNL